MRVEIEALLALDVVGTPVGCVKHGLGQNDVTAKKGVLM